ncbi:MAG: BatD family protein [Flavobacteriaceae bacterium]|nr:BatD family protein [Flavobacteriaceae bacterium]
MKQHLLTYFTLVFFSCIAAASAQLKAEVTTAVDSTQVRIGEQINLVLQIKTDSLSMVEFSPEPLFLPFELLEESPIDTLRAQRHYLYTKRYALIQFDSGSYWIPPQKIVVDGVLRFSDSIAMDVATVKVDTLQQPLFDIKPIQLVERNYTQLIQQYLVGFFFLLLLLVLYYLNKQYKKKKAALLEEIPPFDRALNELKALENQIPTAQEEYKLYYSKLTDVVRRYLEEEAAIDALESTSDELIEKLELRKDAGTLDLNLETLNNLKRVLQNADLVKFARSAPELGIATTDRAMVEQVVIETNEALPEPTPEELAATEAFQRELEQKRRIQKIQLIGISSLAVVVIAAILAIAYYGFTPVKDTVFRYPTKVLLDNFWVKSYYGTPPIALQTPNVLIRETSSTAQKTTYSAGDPFNDFYTQLSFEKRTVKDGKELSEEEQEALARELLEAAIAAYEAKGAVNLLVQNDSFTTADGTSALRLFGTLDLPNGAENLRCRFVSIIFPFKNGTTEIQFLFSKDDRYGEEIEKRILASIEIIKEL